MNPKAWVSSFPGVKFGQKMGSHWADKFSLLFLFLDCSKVPFTVWPSGHTPTQSDTEAFEFVTDTQDTLHFTFSGLTSFFFTPTDLGLHTA